MATPEVDGVSVPEGWGAGDDAGWLGRSFAAASAALSSDVDRSRRSSVTPIIPTARSATTATVTTTTDFDLTAGPPWSSPLTRPPSAPGAARPQVQQHSHRSQDECDPEGPDGQVGRRPVGVATTGLDAAHRRGG